jgi:hypothetical protein
MSNYHVYQNFTRTGTFQVNHPKSKVSHCYVLNLKKSDSRRAL